MRHTISLLFLWIIVSFTLFSQEGIQEFGELPSKYVKADTIENAQGAPAAILYDYGEIIVSARGPNFVSINTIHRRIKILSESALSYADISIPYYEKGGLEYIAKIKGITYNMGEDGEVVQTELNAKSSVFDEDVDGYYHNMKFSMPNVKVGSVIEYSYRLTSKNWAYIPTWYFQHEIPTLYSSFTTVYPTEVVLRVLSFGEQFPINKEVKRRNLTVGTGESTTYTAANITAKKEEPYTNAIKNYVTRLDFQIQQINIPGQFTKDYLKSWGQIAGGLMSDDDFGRRLRGGRKIKEILAQALADQRDDEDSVATIFRYVRDNYSWSGRYGMYAPQRVAELVKEKEGNGSSLNFFLINLLNEAGYKAHPVLISTRKNGMIQQIFPTARQFNHTIVHLKYKGKDCMMDVANQSAPYNMLPVADLNRSGLLIQPDEKRWRWIELNEDLKGTRRIMASFDLTESGELKGNTTVVENGYAAAKSRNSCKDEEDKTNYLASLVSESFTDVDIHSKEVANIEELQKPLTSKIELTTRDFVQSAGERIYIQPMMGEAIAETPFKLDKRSYPVDFIYNQSEHYTMSLKIPEGYELEESIKPIVVSLPDKSIRFIYQVQQLGKLLNVSSVISINKTWYPVEEYDMLRGMYDVIVKKHAEQLVFRKIEDK